MKKSKNPLEKEKDMEKRLMSSINESYQSGVKNKDKR
ncbi:hypothetical protein BN982_00563 [Halobacillus karajensis]|uniref:Uncharacterized protein n=1 Tax=Halobacillus karajensis TaxID=195088 RepID=A0A024P8J5_9BACI|nr:hypothetical protein BN982_00563 [Halobacillus karajensis]CDQ24657.1 hypothetical protein BN983_02951 [Halobacillus karajensis]CDQ29097.1 hypothetical protein BN981_03458 [Halobacillus karajensis]